MVELPPDVLLIIRKHALMNAYRHDGKCELGPVLARVLGERPDLRSIAKELRPVVGGIVDEVNRLSPEEQLSSLRSHFPELLAEAPKAKAEEKKLPPLPNAEKYASIVTRFSPNPDCVLHLGSARAIVLSHDYAREYGGRFLLRFEDTDPRLKKSSLVFYDLIRDDLKWLHCPWDEEFIQSDRLPIYYGLVERLVRLDGAYVCVCEPPAFRGYTIARRACLCRNLGVEAHLDRWEKMLSGEYKEGQAVVRVKTDLNHPNPAVRDWPALRIIDTERHAHPRTGSKYRVWPLYNFAAGVDDHLMGITHIIRGKEHYTNMVRQMYMYGHMKWAYPTAIHYGRMKVEGGVLSKSKILKGISQGLYEGFDDPRLATFLALRRRGIQPEAIRRVIYDIGIKPVDVTISWPMISSYNRQIVDKIASRYFAILDGVGLHILGFDEGRRVRLPKHPEDKERGTRELEVRPSEGVLKVYVSTADIDLLLSRPIVRLMGFMNVCDGKRVNDHLQAHFSSFSVDDAKAMGAPLIHWLPTLGLKKLIVVMPDGRRVEGLAEADIVDEPVGSIVQFERIGFARIDSKSDDMVTAYFTSR